MKSELTSSNGVRLIPVTPGSFIMGSPQIEAGHEFWERERQVTLSHQFYLGATPVTQRQFALVTGENPTDHAGTAEDAPVDSVRWQAATEFCAKLTEIDRDAGILSKDWEYRLPTETEWEYACRAGTSGATYGPLDCIAWHFGNSDLRTHPVCEKSPPSLHVCIYEDRPEMFEWLVEHGADMERREQDYGSTPLNCAVVMRHKSIIRTLVERGADTTRAMDLAQRGLAGDFEDDPRLDREGYREIVKLLRELGVK